MGTRISYVCISHTGNFRRRNQDNFFCVREMMPEKNRGTAVPVHGSISAGKKPLFGVFDGLGGEEKGETAAFLAAREAGNLTAGRFPQAALADYCRNANQRICAYSSAFGLKTMGTTAALALFSGRRVSLCNLGDSRIFRFRSGELIQLSQDHLYSCAYGGKPPLSQYLGMPPSETILEPYIVTERVKPGDLYLLCSDGLTDMLTMEQIQSGLSAAGIEDAAERLLEQALSQGGKDNITLILCKVSKFMWFFHS